MNTIHLARRLALAALVVSATPFLPAGCASAQPASLPPSAVPGVTTTAGGACRPRPGVRPAAQTGTSALEAATADMPAPDAAPTEASAWTYQALAFLWVPGVKGKAGRGGAIGKSDVSVSDMADVLKNTLERALLTHVEARTDGWGLFGEIIALKLEDDASTTKVAGPVKLPNGRVVAPKRSIEIDTEAVLKMTLAEVGVSINIADALLRDAGSNVRLEALIGARYYDLELDIELNDQRITGDGEDWLDGFVGARARIQFDEEWNATLRADIGGFDIGTSSHRTWRAAALVRYQPWESVGIFAGWNHIDIDWDRGSGANKAVFDIRMSGPILGVTYDF